MPTIEERLQAIEQEHTQLRQEHTQLKKTTELQTIAIGALVNKATLEQLNEKYDRIFDALMAHDHFTNEQLAELREQQTKEDGKIVGLQTEMRQRLTEQDGKLTGLQTEMRQRFTEQDSKLAEHTAVLAEHTTVLAEHTTLLKQILALLSERQ